MGYGKRLSREATIVQIDQDYRTVGKNRDISLLQLGEFARADHSRLHELGHDALGRSFGQPDAEREFSDPNAPIAPKGYENQTVI